MFVGNKFWLVKKWSFLLMLRMKTIFLGVLLLIAVSASASTLKKACPDLSGSYAFDGQWEKFVADGPNSESIRKSVTETPPRFDERALSIVARSVIGPQLVALKHNIATGLLTVDVSGAGVDQQWKQYGKLVLPVELSLVCKDGRLLREEVSHGSDGFASTELRDQIFVTLDTDGYLHAEGERLVTSGLIFKKKLEMRWVAKFKKIV